MMNSSQTMGIADSPSLEIRGMARWFAPDLLTGDYIFTGMHTMETDVWAFGMTLYVSYLYS